MPVSGTKEYKMKFLTYLNAFKYHLPKIILQTKKKKIVRRSDNHVQNFKKLPHIKYGKNIPSSNS